MHAMDFENSKCMYQLKNWWYECFFWEQEAQENIFKVAQRPSLDDEYFTRDVIDDILNEIFDCFHIENSLKTCLN